MQHIGRHGAPPSHDTVHGMPSYGMRTVCTHASLNGQALAHAGAEEQDGVAGVEQERCAPRQHPLQPRQVLQAGTTPLT